MSRRSSARPRPLDLQDVPEGLGAPVPDLGVLLLRRTLRDRLIDALLARAVAALLTCVLVLVLLPALVAALERTPA